MTAHCCRRTAKRPVAAVLRVHHRSARVLQLHGFCTGSDTPEQLATASIPALGNSSGVDVDYWLVTACGTY